MGKAYRVVEERFQRLAQLDHAITFLQWDQLVMMPPGGNESRAKSIAELAAMRHEMLTADDMEELLDAADGQEKDPVSTAQHPRDAARVAAWGLSTLPAGEGKIPGRLEMRTRMAHPAQGKRLAGFSRQLPGSGQPLSGGGSGQAGGGAGRPSPRPTTPCSISTVLGRAAPSSPRSSPA